MTELVDPSLTVRFPLLTGRDTTRVSSYSIKSAYTTSTDSFEFSLYDEDRTKLQRLEMQPVELLINGASQLIGRIDATVIGNDGSAVTCRGRDYMADLVECNVDPSAVIKKGMTLADALQLVFAPVGIKRIVGDDDVQLRQIRASHPVRKSGKGGGHHKKKIDDFAIQPGEGMYELGSRLAARLGGMLQPSSDRTELVVDAPSYEQETTYSLICADDSTNSAANNVIEAEASRDWSSFPTFALFTNKQGSAGSALGGLSATKDIWEVAAQSEELIEIIQRSTFSGRIKPTDSQNISKGELYRLLYHRDNDSKTKEQIENAIARAVAERLRETLRYTVEVRGHQDPKSGALWAIDTLAQVTDSIRGVNEVLWIHSREFSYTKQAGATTRLELWRPNSFVINTG